MMSMKQYIKQTGKMTRKITVLFWKGRLSQKPVGVEAAAKRRLTALRFLGPDFTKPSGSGGS